jgi:hypothetical protein
VAGYVIPRAEIKNACEITGRKDSGKENHAADLDGTL